MRSARSLVVILVVVAGCGNDVTYDCETSPLTYQTFGEPFMTSWCRGCHSDQVLMRQDAPLDVNLDTLEQVRTYRHQIIVVAGDGASMPPAGGPSDEERELLKTWIACGAR